VNKKAAAIITFGFAILIIGVVFLVSFRYTAPVILQNPAHNGNPSNGPNYVTVIDDKFMLNGHANYFVGTNFWEGMALDVNGAKGDRNLLVDELDRLQQLGKFRRWLQIIHPTLYD
jgi:hypothetical protein